MNAPSSSLPVLAGRDHLLYRLTGHFQLTGEVGLGETFGEQSVDELPSLTSQLPRDTRMLNGRGPDLLQLVDELRVLW
jgi:hypothetical protein